MRVLTYVVQCNQQLGSAIGSAHRMRGHCYQLSLSNIYYIGRTTSESCKTPHVVELVSLCLKYGRCESTEMLDCNAEALSSTAMLPAEFWTYPLLIMTRKKLLLQCSFSKTMSATNITQAMVAFVVFRKPPQKSEYQGSYCMLVAILMHGISVHHSFFLGLREHGKT